LSLFASITDGVFVHANNNNSFSWAWWCNDTVIQQQYESWCKEQDIESLLLQQHHVESIEILCVWAAFFSISLWIPHITKGPFKNTFQSFNKNLDFVSDISILGFWDWNMAHFLECMGGNETGHESGWCMMQPPHRDNTMWLVWFHSYTILKWNLIALLTCPCYIALDGSSCNACSTRWCTGCTVMHCDCSHVCRRQWLQVWSRNSL
jgi:hypothetical protein